MSNFGPILHLQKSQVLSDNYMWLIIARFLLRWFWKSLLWIATSAQYDFSCQLNNMSECQCVCTCVCIFFSILNVFQQMGFTGYFLYYLARNGSFSQGIFGGVKKYVYKEYKMGPVTQFPLNRFVWTKCLCSSKIYVLKS